MMSSRLLAWMAAVILAASTGWADLAENQVLVLYNSADPDSQQIRDHYLSVHPGALSFDFNDPTLGSGNISYADYVSKIRNPLRNYLASQGLSEQVAVFTLTKGLPHRILDTDDATVGDDTIFADGRSSFHEFNAADATYASVDSQLTLLWQDLDAGEAGGSMDSHADNLVSNPYHARTQSVTGYSRSNVTTAQTFTNVSNKAWQFGGTPGDIYLTTRLDGHTAAQVIDAINRAGDIRFNPLTHTVILDENDNRLFEGSEYDDAVFFSPKVPGTTLGYHGNDYEQAAAVLAGRYDAVVFDSTAAFVQGATGSSGSANPIVVTGPVAYLGTFGTVHNPAITSSYTDTFVGQLVNGAILNSLESYSARALGNITGDRGQEQLADWIANGGTLGIGNVWEPFGAAMADNALLLDNFLFNGLSWAEAAWSSIPFLSWQQVVFGDPLARVTLSATTIPEPATLLLLTPAALALLRRRRN